MLAGIWMKSLQIILLLFFHHRSLSQRPPKFKYLAPEDQNQIASLSGSFEIPTIPVNANNITIGALLTLTDAKGAVDINGIQQTVAFQCAVSSLNVNGTNDGEETTSFNYRIINDASSGPISLNAAVDLLEHGVSVVVGPGTSDTATNVGALYGSYDLTTISGSATAALLADQIIYRSFLRTIPSDAEQAAAIASTMVYFNWSLVTPIYTDDTYGLSGQRQFTLQAQNNRILLTCGRVLKKGQLNGIQDTIRCLSSSQSNVVMLWMAASDASNVIASFYQNPSLERLIFIATDAWSLVQDFDAFSQGRFPLSYLTGTLGYAPKIGDQTAYRECFSGYNPGNTDIPNFDEYWQVSFRCLLGADESIYPLCPEELSKRNGTNINCRCTGTESTTELRPDGKVNYYYDSVYAVANALEQIRNNCTQVSEAVGSDYCNLETITSFELGQAIRSLEFEGLTGLVAFEGNDRKNSTFEIYQQAGNATETLVGTYLNGTLTIQNDKLVWKTKKTPLSKIIPSLITISDPLGAIVLAFVVIGLITSFCFSVFFYRRRNEKIIKKTSPFFCQLILIGIDLCLISQIIWMVPQSSLTCIIKVWLLAIGFGLIMGNLLAKTYRIFKIFNNIRVTSLVIRDTDLLYFSAGVVLMEIILLAVYTFAGGLLVPVNIQSVSDSLLIIVQCSSPSKFLQTMMNIVLLAVNALLVLFGVVIAYLTRNVDSAFNEAKYIAITMYMYLLVTIILLPLYYTAGDSSSSVSRQFILRALAVMASMYFTLVALFVPKIVLVYATEHAEKKASHTTQTGGSGTSRRIITNLESSGADQRGRKKSAANDRQVESSNAIFSKIAAGSRASMDVSNTNEEDEMTTAGGYGGGDVSSVGFDGATSETRPTEGPTASSTLTGRSSLRPQSKAASAAADLSSVRQRSGTGEEATETDDNNIVSGFLRKPHRQTKAFQ